MILEKLKEMLNRINPDINTENIDGNTSLLLDLGLDSLSMMK